MDNRQFIQLLEKYRLGMATEEECKFIELYYDLFEMEPGLESWQNPEEIEQLKEEVRKRAWAKIHDEEARAGKLKKLFTRPARVAAAVIAIIATGFMVFVMSNRRSAHEVILANNAQPQNKNDILPGGNKAILTLANGQKIILDSVSSGGLVRQEDVDVRKQSSGELVYQAAGLSAKGGDLQLNYNTITIPMGGEFKVILSDGTKVWLNAGSSLHYPVAFVGNARRVSLSGEAYFEVAKQAGKSFVVEAGDAEIQVLGTHFNVNAYGDENAVRTTLAEGIVKVSKAGESRLLKPGEQASLYKQTGEIKVSDADVELAIAWTNDLFHFDNTNIELIMREVSRWYNVEVVYATRDLDKKNFSGIMSRYADVASLLQRLELTGVIHFKVEGKKITVMD